ncbi:uncharacterized protein ASCRUDRAFT_76035 [Ascoidea rubescens DSM 1968]|uniref:Uncharacterized protein n=1 Tax=Ascoidea rubescens DSM 1968 TaxID=1344418 RepID=A0A1D2VGN3_9ASCO|nr:hypothetical protein ASCRUDRAFT_76035 [Ascoidea rubescens DSM 1968]ODV60653.1 hypothetical protein ASCRUDRAFT_76035 [Ascoidea rubescens DSM 1968]
MFGKTTEPFEMLFKRCFLQTVLLDELMGYGDTESSAALDARQSVCVTMHHFY